MKNYGKNQRLSYLAACDRGESHKIAARTHRKHGVFPPNDALIMICRGRNHTDRLATPAKTLWYGDLHCVRFPSAYGSWNGDIVPFGGYFDARNPGYGKSPRVTWKLRTGGRITTNGHYKPKRLPLP